MPFLIFYGKRVDINVDNYHKFIKPDCMDISFENFRNVMSENLFEIIPGTFIYGLAIAITNDISGSLSGYLNAEVRERWKKIANGIERPTFIIYSY